MLQVVGLDERSPSTMSNEVDCGSHDRAADDASPDDPSAIANSWRSVLPTAAELRRARLRLHAKSVWIALILAASYWALVLSDLGWPFRVLGGATLVVGIVALATGVMHDGNHGSFSRHPWLNRVAGYSLDALGGSSWLWRFKHNTLHHGNPNVEGVDSDISQAPFARLAPMQPLRPWHRWQHVYLWFLYGFFALKNLLFGDFRTLASARIGDQPLRTRPGPTVVARILAGKGLHLGWAVVIPLLTNPWWGVLAFYLVSSWMVGFVLAVTFQLAHCVDVAEFDNELAPRRGGDFFAHQLRTTVDIASPVPVLGHAFRWLVGGLDHQIEHHLAPRLPHTVYPIVAARFHRVCREAGVTYRLHPGVWAALRSHGRWLRAMGRPEIAVARR
jgi:linoleoyl-CoA desaturase